MNSKSIAINSLEIAYLEVNPDAKNTVFFIHGNSGSSRTWLNQLNASSLNAYRMIAFDLPAHGGSSASADPENDYSAPGLGKLIADAINILAPAGNFIITGFSLGSNVLGEALTWLKPNGIVLTSSSAAGGTHTMDKIFQPGVDGTVFFSDTATAESINNWAENMSYNPTYEQKQLTIDDYNRVKPGFRPTFFKTVMEGKYSDEIALLQAAGFPVLVIFGQNDKMVQPGYLDDAPFSLWGDKVNKLPEAGHTAHIDQASMFNQLLLEYSEGRFDSSKV